MLKTTLSTAAATSKLRLNNGATLLLKPYAGAPRIAMTIFIPGGNQLDPIPGFSDLVDRLLMKGTEKRDQEQLSIDIDSLTLEVDTDTKRDYSIISASLLEEDLEASFEIISDIFFNATFSEFDREKEKMAGEIQMDLDSPRSRASDLFIRTIFEDTCYSAVSSVIQENLGEMNSVYQAQKHYKQAYRPDRMIISMVGDQLPPERVTKLFEQYFPEENTSGAALGSTHDLLKNLKIQENKVVTFPRDDSNQAHIFKGWLAPEVKSADYPAMVVLNTILGGAGLSSRLFLELRDKQGLAYNVRSTYEAFQHKGLFYLYIGTEPSNKEKCLQGFITECDKLVQTAVSDKELGEAKENIIGRRAIYLETAGQQANYVGANYALGRSLEDIDALPQRILAVTSAEVQAVAQKYLTLPSVISVVGPSNIL